MHPTPWSIDSHVKPGIAKKAHNSQSPRELASWRLHWLPIRRHLTQKMSRGQDQRGDRPTVAEANCITNAIKWLIIHLPRGSEKLPPLLTMAMSYVVGNVPATAGN